MAGSTASVDIKRERRDLYSGRVGRFDLVEVPPMRFLMVDGHGDPDTAPAYRADVESLYSTSYSVRALARSEPGRVHTVGPLEGCGSRTTCGYSPRETRMRGDGP